MIGLSGMVDDDNLEEKIRYVIMCDHLKKGETGVHYHKLETKSLSGDAYLCCTCMPHYERIINAYKAKEDESNGKSK